VSSCAAANLGRSDSPTTSCGSNVAVVGQYSGGDRTVCIDQGDKAPFQLALLSYSAAAWVLTGAVDRVSAVQVYSYDNGTTCESFGAPVHIQISGSSPANPYSYGSSMGQCATHTGYAGAVFGVDQSAVCHMNCGLSGYTCLQIDP
jgi:hypothetical protein